MQVGVASGSELAAKAGARIAEEGGNAVDAAIAAVMTSAVAEIGLCSLGGSGALTIWPPGGEPVTLEGTPEMPGRGLPKERFGHGAIEVLMAYGRGTPTMVGHGAVATPGMVAACGAASERYGRLPWRELLQPAKELARDGFPMQGAGTLFLEQTRESVFSWNQDALAPFLDEDGEILRPGSIIRIPHLDETLDTLAEEGADALYRGDVGRRLSEHVLGGGGLLTREDLAAYRVSEHRPLRASYGGWELATYPPPSFGGVTLAAMLRLMGDRPRGAWTADETAHMLAVQREIFRFRYERLDEADDVPAAAQELLAAIDTGELHLGSPSTVHTSAADSGGLACAATMSAGYGSGVVAPGTGVLMNNSLGEIELNRRGLHALPPGRRLATNMAPTVARNDGAVMAIGSPGADRITSAILQTLVNFAQLGLDLQAAVDHPRAHMERTDDGWRVACERGLPVEGLGLPLRVFEELDLFFGGVSAVLHDPESGFSLATDPRRAGGTALGEGR